MINDRERAYIAAVHAAVEGDADSWSVAADALEEIGDMTRARCCRALAEGSRREGRPVCADPCCLLANTEPLALRNRPWQL